MQSEAHDAVTRDSDIAELLRERHRDRAFDALLQRYEGKIYRLCCAMLRNRAQAEDAAQESFVRIWKALDRYDARASLSSWIYAITRNRCLTALERRRVMDSMNDGAIETEVAILSAPDEACTADRSAQLKELINRLPERLRRTLLLYYYQERSTSEVALMLGCPAGTVKTLLFWARAALVEQLKRRGLDDPRIWLESAP
jgi:RNA polymerase sigma-70 factor, ECF subfamily